MPDPTPPVTTPAITADAAPQTSAVAAPEFAGVGAELTPELRSRVDAQVAAFMQTLATTDIGGEDFRRRLDAAFKLGRKEIAEATRLNTLFLRENFIGLEHTAAYQAMAELRTLMDRLNPGRHGNLLGRVRWLGFIPGGTRLQAYLRKFESAAAQIDRLLEQMAAAQDDLDADALALDDTRQQLTAALRNLNAAAHFAQALQRQLRALVIATRAADPARARLLETEALFYATQNLDGLLAQQAVTLNGILALEPLKKTAREMSIGLDRLRTTGMAALAVAQTLALATQRQARTQEAMQATREVIGDLVASSAQQLGQHVQTVGRFASDPILDVAKLQAAFDSTFKAIDALDQLRSSAVETMEKNNAALGALVARAQQTLQRTQGAGAADPQLDGPVHLAP